MTPEIWTAEASPRILAVLAVIRQRRGGGTMIGDDMVVQE
jgi:hypothetical protein